MIRFGRRRSSFLSRSDDRSTLGDSRGSARGASLRGARFVVPEQVALVAVPPIVPAAVSRGDSVRPRPRLEGRSGRGVSRVGSIRFATFPAGIASRCGISLAVRAVHFAGWFIDARSRRSRISFRVLRPAMKWTCDRGTFRNSPLPLLPVLLSVGGPSVLGCRSVCRLLHLTGPAAGGRSQLPAVLGEEVWPILCSRRSPLRTISTELPFTSRARPWNMRSRRSVSSSGIPAVSKRLSVDYRTRLPEPGSLETGTARPSARCVS